MLQASFSGLASGGAYAALAVCIVMLYRTAGVVNFAQAAIGAFGTYVALTCYGDGVGFAPAAAVGAAAAGVLSAVIGATVNRWFHEANAEVLSTVSIAVFVGLLAVGQRLFGDRPRALPQTLNDAAFEIGGVTITKAGVAVLAGTVVVAVAIAQLLRRTLVGVRIRAVSERSSTAELLGIPARRLVVVAWAISGILSTLALLVLAPTRPSDFSSLSLLVIPALGAALVGSFRSVSVAIAAGVAIGLLQGLSTSWDAVAPYATVIPVAVAFVALMWTQRAERWDALR